MTRKRSTTHHPHGARPPAPRRPAPAWLTPAIVYGVPVLAALFVHRGALGNYVSTDDLILFERARGLAPFPATLWRWLSGQAYFRVLWPVFGVEPTGWHALALLLHALATALVAAWARRLGAGRTVAVLAALLFGTAARARTVVGQVTGVGECLAAIFTLLALIRLAGGGRGARAEAPAWHAAALLSKENAALAPLAALAGAPAGEWRARLRDAALPLALSVALWAYVLLARPATGSLGGEAYAFGFGRHVLDHLLTYTLWSADPVHLTGAIAVPPPLPWAAAALAVLAALVLYAWHSGSRVARAGLVLWAATLLPVLPLVNAVYEHYLYVPRAGFALALAAAVAHGAGPRRRAAYALAGFLAVVHALTATLYLNTMRGYLIPELGLPRDGFLRKMEAVRNAASSVRGRFGAGPVRLVIFTPPGAAKLFDTRTGEQLDEATGPRRRYSLLQAVSDEGRGLRALEPALADVRFSEHATAADTGAVLATNLGDGRLVFHGVAPAAWATMADGWEQNGYAAAAAGLRAEVAALDSAAAGLRSSPAPAPAR